MAAVDIRDDDFLTRRSHSIALCQELLKRNCQVAWSCRARPARLDPDVLKLMKRAGCKYISFGVETGTDEVLKASQKAITCEEIYEAMHVVGKAGFDRIGVFLIVGLPAESLDTIDRTVTFVKSLQPLLGRAWQCKTLLGQLPLIYPGTGLETMGKVEGCLPEDFSWNRPYLEPKRYLPLINYRYKTVPHFESRTLGLEEICAHLKKHYWDELTRGRKRRFRLAALRKLKVTLGLG